MPYQGIDWIGQNGDTLLSGAVGATGLCGDLLYTLVVEDFAGCIATLTQYVDAPSDVVSAVTNFNNVSCFGGSDGDATVQAGGGTGTQSDFIYVWAPSIQFSQTSTGLASGSYSVTSSCRSSSYARKHGLSPFLVCNFESKAYA